MILVSGATGQLGREVVRQLLRLDAKGKFAIWARDAEKAKAYADQGIEIRLADFDRPDSLASAFAGVEKFLFISTMSMDRGPQQAAVVDAAVKAGVAHIYYTGIALRNIAQSHVRDLMQSHFDTEARIRGSGLAYTFLRNTIYAEALLQILGPNAPQERIFLPGGSGKAPYIMRDELGAAIANALLGDGHAGKTYNLTASQAWGFDEIATALSQHNGLALSYADIPEADLSQALAAAGLPEFVIWLTLGTINDIRDGQYDIASDALETLLGRAPKGLAQMISEIFV